MHLAVRLPALVNTKKPDVLRLVVGPLHVEADPDAGQLFQQLPSTSKSEAGICSAMPTHPFGHPIGHKNALDYIEVPAGRHRRNGARRSSDSTGGSSPGTAQADRVRGYERKLHFYEVTLTRRRAPPGECCDRSDGGDCQENPPQMVAAIIRERADDTLFHRHPWMNSLAFTPCSVRGRLDHTGA